MIRFILNNQIIQTEAKTGTTLVDFIRDYQQLKGTKIGCREGDCGACTVLVGTLKDNKISYQSITSCISPLGNANGKHIVTIEGLNLNQKLNVAQKAMAENYATQCGFCTPGFVVSYTGYAINSCCSLSNGSNEKDAISGNICRCTGYKSIEKAGFDIQNKLDQLSDNSITTLIKQDFLPEYFASIPEKLKKLQIDALPKGEKIVANGTDLYVRYANDLAKQDVTLIAQDASLKGISAKDKFLQIGASTTVTEIWKNTLINQQFSNLKDFLRLISSQQIRNMGTIGGNFVNASPIGDLSIFFLALNSDLILINTKNQEKRTLAFKDFYQDYKKFDLQKNELIQQIRFQKLQESEFFNFEKVSKRTHLDIASVNSACRIKSDKNALIEAHFSVGGVAAIPKYLEKTNTFLKRKELTIKNVKQAEKIMQQEIAPISDVRGSNIYKRLLARQLFFAHFIKGFPQKFSLTDFI
ncbi:MAG TPA: 2Fe-2S iron-sulfur cluster binding domain-containing protein [Flavobacteriia bacterium]|nr:2Fe-2S iron-sulfur cluster binding domain-containing protein [Flavobacteriia bacterium]